MLLGEHLTAMLRAVGPRRRRVWVGDRRAHLEMRPVPRAALDAVVSHVEEALGALPGVSSVGVNPVTARAVVSFDERLADVDAMAAVLDRIEAELHLDQAPFGGRAEHPADLEPLFRDLLEMGGDVLALGLGTLARATGLAQLPVEVDIAAIVSYLEDAPGFRAFLERRLGQSLNEMLWAVAGATAQALASGPLGPLLDGLYRTTLLTEAAARRRTWGEREPGLCAQPVPFPSEAAYVPERPAPVPAGPVEEYAEKAWFASLGAFGASLVATGSFERASAVLFDSSSKPARFGRDAFAAQLGRTLSGRGILVMDPGALRLLDRVDCVVIDEGIDGEPTHGERISGAVGVLAAAARRSGCLVALATPRPDREPPPGIDRLLPDAAMLPAEVHRLQGEGRVVCLVASGPSPGLAAADCGVGLVRGGGAPPWNAHLLCTESVDDAWLVLEACGVARAVTRQSVGLALAGAGVGAWFSLGGLVPGTSRRVLAVVNTAAALAMANGTWAGLGIADRPRPRRRDETPWHALDADEVLARLGATLDGLPEDEASARRPQAAASPPEIVQLARTFLEELSNPLTPILAAGAGLSVVVGSLRDAAMVGSVVVLNGLVGAVQRHRAEHAIRMLDQQRRPHVRVRRHGRLERVDPRLVVPGDVVELQAGESVPADCRILAADSLEVDESSLTGESLPVAKRAEATAAAAVAERTSMLWDGTTVAAGRATAVVVASGADTEARRALGDAPTPPPAGGIEARLHELTSVTGPVAVASGLAVAGFGLLRGEPPGSMIASAVSLVVAAVPEGLPLLATMTQLAAARRLAGQGVLVRNPRAIEALGRVDVLCADKTGTLTEGRLALRAVTDGVHELPVAALSQRHRAILAAGLRASPDPVPGRRFPHPTDEATVGGGAAAGVARDAGAGGWRLVDELHFEPSRGYHAALADTADGRLLSVKGAPEVVLPRCVDWDHPDGVRRLDEADRGALAAEAGRLAHRGLRVLGVAERTVVHDGGCDDGLVSGLRFLGFLALSDPVRPRAKAAVAGLRRAGVEVLMITGDHPSTAEGIAAELHLLNGGGVLTGVEVDALDDAALESAVARTTVFARVTPAHKARLVQALQRQGRVVAMTGDGANDAPAIRLANVGIALGERGTTAARHAADLVLVNHQIEAIVAAIAEGRALWAAARDAAAVLLGGNLGEVLFTVASSAATGRSALNPAQLLLVNLLTDAAPALAIALRPPAPDALERALREGPDAALHEVLVREIVSRGVASAVGAGAAWSIARATGSEARASTVALVALVGAQLGQTLTSGGLSPGVVAAGLGSFAAMGAVVQTPGLSQLMGCRPLGPAGWATGLGGAAAGTALSLVLPAVMPDPRPWLARVGTLAEAVPALRGLFAARRAAAA